MFFKKADFRISFQISLPLLFLKLIEFKKSRSHYSIKQKYYFETEFSIFVKKIQSEKNFMTFSFFLALSNDDIGSNRKEITII